jgi:predicted transposase YdaD
MCEVAERLVNTGIEQGIEQGIEKERTESIERLLKKGKSPEEIHEWMDYPMEEIESIEAAMLQRV